MNNISEKTNISDVIMRTVNLRSILIARNGLTTDQRNKLYGIWGVNPKPDELTTLDSLIIQWDVLAPNLPESITWICGGCYLGFVIPRISKEFDCLWIGDKTIVNLELKSKSVGDERVKKQLLENRYYLRHLSRNIVSFTFDASANKCYTVDDTEVLNTVGLKDVCKALFDVHKENLYEGEIEELFPPEHFLVSPFNSTVEFLKGEYFLTNQQQEFKNKILKFVDDPAKGNFCAITGGPGSGKTLLLYDIAKTMMQNGKNVLIGHAGGLNAGHNALIENRWQIKYTKNFFVADASNPDGYKLVDADVYFLDEAQRCYNIDQIIPKVVKSGKKLLLSFDSEQVMSEDEQKRDNGAKIHALTGNQCYSLSTNIRTNTAVYEFVGALFDISHSVNKSVDGKVDITYCNSYKEAANLLKILKKKNYHVPKFTPKLHGKEDYEGWFPTDELSAHQVIGQEFDYVASLLSDKMSYNANGKLVSCGRYLYKEDRMLYQILSRARKKIHLVIVNNVPVLERCMKLIGRV